MAKKQGTDKTSVDKTQVIVAIITAVATVTVAYWQFVWKPSQQAGVVTTALPQIEYVGRVLDSGTKAAVHDAKVTLDFQGAPLIVYTDSEGVYRFTISFEGQRLVGRVRVEAPGYENYDRNVTLLLSNLSIEDIRLNALPSEAVIAAVTLTTTPLPIPAVDTATTTPTRTQAPTSTPTPEITPTPIEAPTPTVSTPKFHTISLNEIANATTQEGYVSPPLGQLKIEGILFDLPPGRNSVTTQASSLPNFPTTLRLTSRIYAARQVYLLITGGNVFSEFFGKQIGVVNLYFTQGELYSIPLIAGQNIREWKLLDEVTVSTTSSSQVKEVWRSESTHKGTGVIDLLTIDVPSNYQSDYLVAIEIVDSSADAVGSMDPAINLIALTVLGH